MSVFEDLGKIGCGQVKSKFYTKNTINNNNTLNTFLKILNCIFLRLILFLKYWDITLVFYSYKMNIIMIIHT